MVQVLVIIVAGYDTLVTAARIRLILIYLTPILKLASVFISPPDIRIPAPQGIEVLVILAARACFLDKTILDPAKADITADIIGHMADGMMMGKRDLDSFCYVTVQVSLQRL